MKAAEMKFVLSMTGCKLTDCNSNADNRKEMNTF